MGNFSALLIVIVLIGCRSAASEQDLESIPAPDQTQEAYQPNRTAEPFPAIVHDTDYPTPDTSRDSNPDPGGDWMDRYYQQSARGNCPPVMMPMAGPPGQPGYPGPTGGTGPSGVPGNHGNNGNNGMPGPAGPAGMKGSKGEQGYPGISGAPGVPGLMGQDGPRGPPGTDGEVGLMGIAGKHGLPGTAGMPGESGMPGVEGQKGQKGDLGSPGMHGECNCDVQQRYGTRTSAFSVARTSGLTATDGPVTVTFQHVFTNVGEDYDINTGKFNCSIPGLYFFTINIYKSSTQNFPLVQILLNGDHVVAAIDYGSSDTEDSTTNSVILGLNIGDMVWLQLYDGRELYSSHYRFTTFSGFRIG